MWKSRAQVVESCLKVRRADCVTNAPVPQGTTALSTPPFVRAGYGCRNNTTVLSRPEAAGWAPLVCAGLLTTSLRGLWVSGLLPPGNGGTNEGAATQKPTVRHKGAATQKPTSVRRNSRSNLGARGGDPRTLASWRHLFSASCRGNCLRYCYKFQADTLRDGMSLVFAGTGTRFPGVRLLALPALRNRPWPLRRSRGGGNGRPLLPSFVRHSMCGRADLAALGLKPGPSGERGRKSSLLQDMLVTGRPTCTTGGRSSRELTGNDPRTDRSRSTHKDGRPFWAGIPGSTQWYCRTIGYAVGSHRLSVSSSFLFVLFGHFFVFRGPGAGASGHTGSLPGCAEQSVLCPGGGKVGNQV